MFKNRNILVTGGSGMIGRQLISLLEDKDAKNAMVIPSLIIWYLNFRHRSLRGIKDWYNKIS